MRTLNLTASALFILGLVGLFLASRIPDHNNLWIIVWMISLEVLALSGVLYFVDKRREDKERDPEPSLPVHRLRVARIAALASTDKFENSVSAEHRVTAGFWDSYIRCYTLTCACGHNISAASLEACGSRMDTHHLAFVRFVTSLRKIHTAAVLPGGIGDELAGIGEQMDRDWSELTPTQQREVELLSTEIAWRSEVSNSKLKENIKNFTTFPAVSEPPPEQVHDIEPTAISALIDNSV